MSDTNDTPAPQPAGRGDVPRAEGRRAGPPATLAEAASALQVAPDSVAALADLALGATAVRVALLDGGVRPAVVPLGPSRAVHSAWVTAPPALDGLTSVNVSTPLIATPLTLDPGLAVLLAGSGWGKSYLLDSILHAGAGSVVRVQLGEPLSIGDLSGESHVAATLEAMMLYVLDLAWSAHRDGARAGDDRRSPTILIDGLRELVYGPTLGGTGEGGVNLYSAIQLTYFSNLLVSLDARALATFNPTIADNRGKGKEAWDRLLAVLLGSVTVWEGAQPRALLVHERGPLSARETRPFAVRDGAQPAIATPQRKGGEGAFSVSMEVLTAEDASSLLPPPASPYNPLFATRHYYDN